MMRPYKGYFIEAVRWEEVTLYLRTIIQLDLG